MWVTCAFLNLLLCADLVRGAKLSDEESQWSLASRKLDLKNGLVTFFSCRKSDRRGKMSSTLPVDSVMALYLSLETGKLWFPAQVFNRENGYVGFMMSSSAMIITGAISEQGNEAVNWTLLPGHHKFGSLFSSLSNLVNKIRIQEPTFDKIIVVYRPAST
ncbi:hypothetical protein POM88_001411 [Heracleum sosnowskyi]|uniref:Uncharacterized protein n=1 Tax=Heracleum sosnowskyi TaxID=360622 RepID=A0AAD8NAT7_9APIA|nr:hypothetical protein POM88_001411 [Heracleum sosnowskyi]